MVQSYFDQDTKQPPARHAAALLIYFISGHILKHLRKKKAPKIKLKISTISLTKSPWITREGKVYIHSIHSTGTDQLMPTKPRHTEPALISPERLHTTPLMAGYFEVTLSSLPRAVRADTPARHYYSSLSSKSLREIK